jgi:hypothetical protein
LQRSRPGPPTASSETGVASLPRGLPSLEVLIAQARSPGAARGEVDALIAGLSQPLASEQSPRERADLLLALIEDKHLGDFSGSKGLTVRSAAVEALLALGYPYALEVPPDALEDRSAHKHAAGTTASRRIFSGGKGWAGFFLVTLIGLAQLIPMLLFTAGFNDREKWIPLVATLFISGTTFLPALLVALGHYFRSQLLRGLGGTWLVLAGLLWLLPGLFVLMNTAFGVVPVTVGALLIASVILMDSAAPRDQDPVPE